MFTEKFLIEEWDGNKRGDIATDRTSLSQLEEDIKMLDGKRCSTLIVEGDNTSLTIGGGNDKRYTAVFTVGVDEEFYNLINEKGDEEAFVKIIAGGQAGDYPTKLCVSLDAALEATREYAETGKRSSNLLWEADF